MHAYLIASWCVQAVDPASVRELGGEMDGSLEAERAELEKGVTDYVSSQYVTENVSYPHMYMLFLQHASSSHLIFCSCGGVAGDERGIRECRQRVCGDLRRAAQPAQLLVRRMALGLAD